MAKRKDHGRVKKPTKGAADSRAGVQLEEREPTAAALADPTAGVLLQALEVKDLIAWPGLNPRQHFDPAALQELTDSVAAVGVKEPLGVKLNANAPHYVFKGERRLRAAQAAGLTHVPAVVSEINEAEAFQLALLENAQRSQLTAIEEARAIRRYGELYPNEKQEEIGAIFGYGAAWVSNRLRLLELPDTALALLEDGLIQASSARDHLLLLNRIPAEYADLRQKLLAAVVAGVQRAVKLEGSSPLEDPVVEHIVERVVRDALPPLVGKGAYQRGEYYTGPGNVNNYAYVTEAEYKKAGLPVFEASSRHGGKQPYALDLKWWKGQNAAAAETMAAEEKKAAAERKRKKTKGDKGAVELLAKHEAGKPVDLGAGTDKAQIIRKSTFKLCQVGAGRVTRNELEVVDPRALPREQLFLVKEYFGHFLAFIGEEEQLTEARNKAEREIQMSIRTKRRGRGKADAAEVDGRQGVAAVPDLVALLSGLGRWTGHGHETEPAVILATLADLGIELERWTAVETPLEGDELLQAILMDIPPQKVEQLARVLALRITRGDFDSWQKNTYDAPADPLEVAAKQAWMVTQDRLTRERILFKLPAKLEGVATVVEEDADDLEPACRVCGCTEDEPCEEGCEWDYEKSGENDDMICSACVAKGQLQPPEPEQTEMDEIAHGPGLGGTLPLPAGTSGAKSRWWPQMPARSVASESEEAEA